MGSLAINILLYGLCVAISAQFVASASYNATAKWHAYKVQHGKSYENAQIEALRRETYFQNKLKVDQFNNDEAQEAGFTMGLNHLSDRLEAELNRLNGFKSSGSEVVHNSPEAQKFLDDILNDDSIEVPKELDWRKTPGRVSRVKNQGQCGSCWAFSATGALEGQQKVLDNHTVDIIELSEQNLVDCVEQDNGCDGGLTNDAFDFIQTERGIESEESYPYEADTKECRFKRIKAAMTDSGSAFLPAGDEQTLMATVAKFGPVSVAIHASAKFMSYLEGVYYDKHCPNRRNDLNHAVLVVGYGTDPKLGDFWIVKNSWSAAYGEQGYIRMARNRGNNCGIATYSVIPTFSN